MDDLRSLLPPMDVNRRVFVAGSVAAGFALATQPVCAQTMIVTDGTGLTAGMVTVPTSDGSIPAYRAAPANAANAPVVLVVQEIFGVHEHIRDVCRRLARQGYLAIAPELYVRQGDVSKIADIPQIMPIVAKVPDAQVMSDLDACVAWAKGNGGDTARLAITGFCWGGRITWLYAAHNPGLKAGIAWYGRLVGNASELQPRHPVDIAKDLKAPVLGLYGAADTGIPVDTVEKMRAALPAGSKSEIVVYPDAPHAFHADYRPSYREAPAKDGWQKLLAWLKTNGV